MHDSYMSQYIQSNMYKLHPWDRPEVELIDRWSLIATNLHCMNTCITDEIKHITINDYNSIYIWKKFDFW